MKSKKLITLVVIGIVGVSVFLFFINFVSNDPSSEENETTPTNTVSQTDNESVVPEQVTPNEQSSGDSAKNPELATGNYNTTINYLVPEGHRESIEVSMTLDNGVITDVEAVHTSTNNESIQYQSDFDDNYQDEVIGQEIDTLSLSRVGGASLTTQAFMDAVDEIINQM